MPDGILARVPHEIARYNARVGKKKGKKRGREAGVIHVKLKSWLTASRAYSPIFECQPHLLLLTVFLVG